MSQKWTKWSYENPPVEGAFLTERGWEIPLEGTDPAQGLTELLVAISAPNAPVDQAAEANILGVSFSKSSYNQGGTMTVKVTFNEEVDVTAGATIAITTTGATTSFNLSADAQSGNVIRFTGTVPSETATLSIAAQTLGGTITDSIGGAATDLTVSADIAADAGTADVA